MRKSLIIIGVIVFVFVILSPAKNLTETLDPSAKPQDDKQYSLLFVGDIMLDRLVKIRSDKATGPLNPFLLIASSTRAADLTIANLEGPISDRGANQGSIYSFRFEPIGTINALQFAGFDVLSLANNHIWDWGKLAAGDTMTHLTDAGISYVGFGKNYDEANAPVIRLVGDSYIAFFNFTNLYPKSLEADTTLGISDFSAMHQSVSSLKSSGRVDIIVVLLHWGVEYQAKSSPWQQELAHTLIDAGADLVIGSHPHVAQEVERYISSVILNDSEGSKGLDPSGKPQGTQRIGYIAYSLGNFIFDQKFSEETMQGLMVKAIIQDKRVIDFQQIPIKLTNTFQPYILESPGSVLQ